MTQKESAPSLCSVLNKSEHPAPFNGNVQRKEVMHAPLTEDMLWCISSVWALKLNKTTNRSRAPPCPQDQNPGCFQAIFRENPYFEQLLGSGTPEVKTTLGSLTKILDPSLKTPLSTFVRSMLVMLDCSPSNQCPFGREVPLVAKSGDKCS